MKYLPLLFAALWRNPARTLLTIFSGVVAFVLFGLLQGLNQGVDALIGSLGSNRLQVSPKENMVGFLPVAYEDKIRAVAGVRAVAHFSWFAGYYQDARNALPVLATDMANALDVYTDLKLPLEQIAAAKRTRTGAVVSRELADHWGWKLGQSVPIGTSAWAKRDGGNTYDFEIVGIYDVADSTALSPNLFLVHYDYFDEVRSRMNGLTNAFEVRVDDPRAATRIARQIDSLFATSAGATNTMGEQAMARTAIRQVADISLIANSVVGAVLFTLLLLTANTMMQSFRERVPELATLRTLGFSPRAVLTLVFAEALVSCVLAALIGSAIAWILFPFGRDALFHGGYVLGSVTMPAVTVASAAGVAVLVALLSSLPPAWRANRLKIVDALAEQ